MADSTTGGLPTVKVSDLTPAWQVYDELLIPGEFQGEAIHFTGMQLKKYAAAGADQYTEDAKNYANAAANSAKAAAGSATAAAESAKQADASANRAEQYSGKPPQIRNRTWWIWNAYTQEYENTGEAVRGNVMFATFAIDIETGLLIMTTPDEYAGPQFQIKNGMLEVSINA